MEKTIKAIGWDGANDSVPQILVGARDRAALQKSTGSFVKVTRKHGRQSATCIAIVNPIFKEHIGHAMLNGTAAQALKIGNNAARVGDKVMLDPRVTETEVAEFRAQRQGASGGQYTIANMIAAAVAADARAQEAEG